jgi:hypothetical protein
MFDFIRVRNSIASLWTTFVRLYSNNARAFFFPSISDTIPIITVYCIVCAQSRTPHARTQILSRTGNPNSTRTCVLVLAASASGGVSGPCGFRKNNIYVNRTSSYGNTAIINLRHSSHYDCVKEKKTIQIRLREMHKKQAAETLKYRKNDRKPKLYWRIRQCNEK